MFQHGPKGNRIETLPAKVLLQKIAAEKTLSPELTAELKAAADQFKQTWKK